MTVIFVTGANRGIGYNVAKEFSLDPANKVIATTRKFANAKPLEDLKRPNLHVIELDITAPAEDVAKAVAKIDNIAPEGVDIVIHNAGTSIDGFSADPAVNHLTRSVEGYEQNFQINTLGSLKVYKAIFPYWAKETGNQKKFVYVSSAAGLINNFPKFVTYGYGTLKAALNFFIKETSYVHSISEVPAIKNSISVSLCPGLVKTDLASKFIEEQQIPASSYVTGEECAGLIKGLVDGLKPEDNGTFHRNGSFEDAHSGFYPVTW